MLLLRAVERRTQSPGQAVDLNPDEDFPLACAQERDELLYLAKALDDKGWAEWHSVHNYLRLSVQPEGWEILEQLDRSEAAENAGLIGASSSARSAVVREQRHARVEGKGESPASLANKFDFDVALSFAGEDRDYVEEVAEQLRESNVRVFYDRYEQAALWGKDLYLHFDEVFRKKARFCLMFLSRHYASKLWTTHERKSAQARAMAAGSEYILPVRLDDSEIPGILPTIGYVNSSEFQPSDICRLVVEKLERHPTGRAASQAVGLFVDFEYIWHALGPDATGSVGPALEKYARGFGQLACRWASVESDSPGRAEVARAMVECGFQFTAPTQRGQSDFALLERITEETIQGHVQTFVLVTGDGDFLDKVMSLLVLGRSVRLVADPSSTNARYKQLAVDRLSFRQARGFAETDFAIDDLQTVLSAAQIPNSDQADS